MDSGGTSISCNLRVVSLPLNPMSIKIRVSRDSMRVEFPLLPLPNEQTFIVDTYAITMMG